MNIKDALEQSLAVPSVDWFAQLTGQLQMCGAKVIPERHWVKLARWLNDLEEDHKEWGKFKHHENHARTEAHESWQWQTFRHKAEDTDLWIVPIDELICLLYQDDSACDFVSIERLTFEGTEDEMDAAIKELLAT